MHVIVTCKYGKERMKNHQEKVKTPFFPFITLSFTMATSDLSWSNFKIIKALMYVIFTSKIEKDPIKNRDIVYPIISLSGFFRLSRAANSAVSGTSRPKFKVIRALMHVISTCKHEKDRIKTAEKKVETSFSPL